MLQNKDATVPLGAVKGTQVLVIEDDPFLSKAYKVKFDHEGITTAFALDGESGLAKVKELKPQLILLDIMLPKKNGFDLLADKNKDPSIKDIPTIILSNLGQEDDMTRGKALGAVDYVVKTSMKIQDVVVKVRQYIK
ncbi:MAG: hypothetical protein A3A97_01065 [Candidatus Terrybacteria bacterium RIFCSPLOWO2_01_FULL_40_23]|uniref:Response regulatory domain-containing protein n=1 Tax=Candidatus Terrybacteria bacterium RIFCSPLOWO2_01_FULL_40_23 TaxID=1802366 RepID=A0A1G2PWN1_9BACT|nr:MAG: hypothetical protein A3A97_01065 [Candidatus Terrybacteria bacterium RIFCSPLOWO2_01_FULL_40_23]